MKTSIQEPQPLTQDEIARAAYQIWEQRGRPRGRDLELWLEAEKQLTSAKTPKADQSTSLLRPTDSPALNRQPAPPSPKPAAPPSLAQSAAPDQRPATQHSESRKGPPPAPLPPVAANPAVKTPVRPRD